jgi:hypothetical protein
VSPSFHFFHYAHCSACLGSFIMLIVLHVWVYSSRLINPNSVCYLTTPPGMVCPNTHRCNWLFYGIIPHMPIKNYIILFSLHLVVATQSHTVPTRSRQMAAYRRRHRARCRQKHAAVLLQLKRQFSLMLRAFLKSSHLPSNHYTQFNEEN